MPNLNLNNIFHRLAAPIRAIQNAAREEHVAIDAPAARIGLETLLWAYPRHIVLSHALLKTWDFIQQKTGNRSEIRVNATDALFEGLIGAFSKSCTRPIIALLLIKS